MAKTKKNKGLRNPAVLAAASSPAGQQAIARTTANASATVDLALKIIKVLVIAGAVYFVYTKIKGSFKKAGSNPNYPPANVSDAQAKAKADALYEAMAGPGANFDAVASLIEGLNYNGWVKIYNAFGHRSGYMPPFTDMDLAEWINDQFDEEELAQLRLLVSNVF